MKIIVKFTEMGITLHVVDGTGSARIGSLDLSPSDISPWKADIFRKVYDDGKSYDVKLFFKTWISLKSLRFKSFMNDEVKDIVIRDHRAILQSGS